MYYLSTVTFILITLFFVWRGYQKGFGGAVIRILSCLLGYIMAILLVNPISTLLSKLDFIHGLLVYVISGTAVLAIVIIVCDVTGNRAFEKILYKKPIHESTYIALKVGGGFIGILVGCFFGFITAYLISFKTGQLYPESVQYKVEQVAQHVQESEYHSYTEDEYESNIESEYHSHKEDEYEYESNIEVEEDTSSDQSEEESVVEKVIRVNEPLIDRMSKKFVSKAITAAAKVTSQDDASVRIVQIISRDPQLAIIHFRNIANDRRIISVLSDKDVKAKLKRGSVKELLEDDKFRSLIKNPNMRFLKPVAKEYTKKRRDVVATKIIIKAWRRLQRIKYNPRVIEIVSDKKFQYSLQNDSTLKLMINDDLKELIDIILDKK